MATKVKLLRPLDGREEGAVVEYPDADAKRLERRGAVQIVKEKVADEKAAPAPENKKAPAVQNKAADVTRTKKGV